MTPSIPQTTDRQRSHPKWIDVGNHCLAPVTKAQLIPENILLHGLQSPREYPACIEIDPVDGCNHSCRWCFTRPYREGRVLPTADLKRLVDRFAECGGQVVHFSGGGEPLLHPMLWEATGCLGSRSLLEYLSERGIWTGLITNGALLDRLPPLASLPYLAFVRVSLDATCPKDHAVRHGCSSSDFGRIIDGIRALVDARGSHCVPAIGVSCIVDPTTDQFASLAELAKLRDAVAPIGIDFVQLKHIHTEDGHSADQLMQWVGDSAESIDWEGVEVWAHRYEQPTAVGPCHLQSHIGAIDASRRLFPCCHLFGREGHGRDLQAGRRTEPLAGCPAPVCRYSSVNKVVTASVEDAQGTVLDHHLSVLRQNLDQYGFHPYRLFGAAPTLVKNGRT
ncbi:MAG: radical SAM protein [Lentisphaerae bacterium]|nr:radical SAM protein [Lentisphaerota bacterium]